MIKLSGRTQPLSPRYPVLDALNAIKQLGFDGVEICLEVDELAPDRLSPALIESIRERVERLGLSPHAVGYHKDYIYDDALFEKTQIAIRLTPAFGTNLLIFSGTRRRSGDVAEWQRMVERTRQLVSLAQDYDVILAQEFEPGFVVGTTAELLNLFAEIPSSNLAANLDLGHVFLCDPDPVQAIHQVGSKIVHGHVENMRAGVHDHLLPQEGDMPLGAYLHALDEIGFAGSLALDLYKHDYAAIAPGAIACLRKLMA